MKLLFKMSIILILAIALTSVMAKCQQTTPILWERKYEKIGDHLFRFTLTAKIADGWHTYSQVQPDDAICIPISVYTWLPRGCRMLGTVKETGDRLEFKDSVAGTSYGYKNNLKLEYDIRTNVDSIRLRCEVEYQACTDEKCMKPPSYKFTEWLINTPKEARKPSEK